MSCDQVLPTSCLRFWLWNELVVKSMGKIEDSNFKFAFSYVLLANLRSNTWTDLRSSLGQLVSGTFYDEEMQ